MIQKSTKRINLISLGCPKNQVDSEEALGCLKTQGFNLTADPQKADVLIVNTCAFIQDAEAEAVQTLLQASTWKQRKKNRQVLVTGCLVSKYGEPRLKQLFPEIDAALLINQDPTSLAQALTSRISHGLQPEATGPRERVLLSGPGSAYLRIAEGCSRQCSFCLIPFLRGPLRSRPISLLVKEAEKLVGRGVQELVVVAQDITQYGLDLPGHFSLTKLLDQLVKIPKLRWIRLMYANPEGVSAGLIQRLAREAKICKYLDIPIQHVDPHVLQRMNRPGGKDFFLGLVTRLRRQIPSIVLRTTLLTGFPGEKETAHQHLLQFIQQAQFDRLGVFTFSRQPGTRAATLSPSVPVGTQKRRRRELMELQAKISCARLAQRVGTIEECMVEERSGQHHVIARTAGDAPEVDGGIVLDGQALPGTMVLARVTGFTDHDLIGAIIK